MEIDVSFSYSNATFQTSVFLSVKVGFAIYVIMNLHCTKNGLKIWHRNGDGESDTGIRVTDNPT